MKKTLLMCGLLALAPAMLYAGDNCREWNTWNGSTRGGYAMGFSNGVAAGAYEFAVAMMPSPKQSDTVAGRKERDLLLATPDKVWGRFIPSSANFGEIIEGVTEICKRSENALLGIENRTQLRRLHLAFARGTITIPNDPALIGELQAFEAKPLPSGVTRYAAPDGLHCVMSLALAWQGLATWQWQRANRVVYMEPVRISLV